MGVKLEIISCCPVADSDNLPMLQLALGVFGICEKALTFCLVKYAETTSSLRVGKSRVSYSSFRLQCIVTIKHRLGEKNRRKMSVVGSSNKL